MDLNRALPRIDGSRFAMTPRTDVPRSTFNTRHSLKTTFEADYLIPIYLKEVLPGDIHKGRVTIFARLSTPLFPIMDDLELDTFFFFVPYRILWTNWVKMMGERANPTDSISFTVPQVVVAPAQNGPGSLWDYFGLPGNDQLDGASSISVNALIPRAYNKIWTDWFRDQNLQNSLTLETDDGPDLVTDYTKQKRNKKHDYFTSCLPWPLKGGTEVSLALSGLANVKGLAIDNARTPTAGTPPASDQTGESGTTGWAGYYAASAASTLYVRAASTAAGADPVIQADMSTIGATINALRLAVATQRLLERDARGGTRYVELLRDHFGVDPQDSRLQRPEYIGGGTTRFQTQAIPQTSATGLTGGTSPLGALGATALSQDQHSFTCYAQEHGIIMGLANLRGEITYQQGIHKMWKRSTRYDFYWPSFAHLGEQAVLLRELYAKGDNQPSDTTVFGYQERWAEYRHEFSRITGLFTGYRSGNIDEWHLAELFASAPALNSTFITSATPMTRILAGAITANMHVLWDSVFDIQSTRPLPMYSVPGLSDRF